MNENGNKVMELWRGRDRTRARARTLVYLYARVQHKDTILEDDVLHSAHEMHFARVIYCIWIHAK